MMLMAPDPPITDSADQAALSTALPHPHEADLLAQAQAGDHRAFAQLYSLHKKRIYSLCMRMVGNVAEAEDMTQ
jgi:RNA polymerase sigma-70 factor (ECF subfamily)